MRREREREYERDAGLAVSILAGEEYIALLGKVRGAIFSLPKIVNKSK